LTLTKRTCGPLLILLLISSATMNVRAQDRSPANNPSRNDVSVTIQISRPNLADAVHEANQMKVTIPNSFSRIYGKPIKMVYLLAKITSKKVGKVTQYQVTIVGIGKP